MKKISIIIAVCLSCCGYLHAQTAVPGGIDFVKGLTWAQIKEKAKTENRYIFVDVFTTWCVPCIKMDKEVFTQKKVGDFFNKNFINVKVQADKGKNDSDPVKRWYSDAAYIAATYNIDSYPTYLFFNPQGEIVHRTTGFTEADKFIAAATTAKGTYFSQKMRFDAGERNPDSLLRLIKSAQLVNDVKLLSIAINQYLSTQKDLLSDENIKFISEATNNTTDLGFKILRTHPVEADRVLGKGRSAEIVKMILFDEIALPYLRTDASVTKYGGGMVVYGGKLRDTVDWAGLKNKLTTEYPDLSERVMASSKLHYYEELPDWLKYTEAVSEAEGIMDKSLLNNSAYIIFSQCENDECIKKALGWAERLVSSGNGQPEYLYTYGSLLYKSGRTKEATEVFENAVKSMGNQAEGFAKQLEKMKKGEKIW
ncbi:thioredoxin family protein [Arcticibacter tournemirensis]|uniref:DUF255 domain-containing protein n=1 Tax=Arcticibacter tournemirensis TaxID=699437 RepID=A0A4Q0M6N0_9SPHI|nr:thioredoxin fold domain-containing protein [Arcticibacter tournemirensis]RXF68645.1 DUF255 domain-containing protein [Arcticibacter tournemirensis]